MVGGCGGGQVAALMEGGVEGRDETRRKSGSFRKRMQQMGRGTSFVVWIHIEWCENRKG